LVSGSLPLFDKNPLLVTMLAHGTFNIFDPAPYKVAISMIREHLLQEFKMILSPAR
jgi:hypothetical protein